MGKIALLVSREEMIYQAHNILQEKKYEISEMRVIQTQDTVMEARNSIAGGASIIIARGLQASLIKQYTDIPVVEIVITAQEMALLIIKAKQIVKKPRPVIAVVGFKNMFCDMSYFDDIYEIELKTYYASNGSELPDAVNQAVLEKADLIIGGDTAVAASAKAEIPSLFLSITEDSLKNAFAMAERMDYAMSVEKKNAAQLEAVLDYSFGGVVNINSEGIITAINPIMKEILGKGRDGLEGKSFAESFPELQKDRIKQVLAGEEENYSSFVQISGAAVFLILAPVRIENRVEGAVLSCHKVAKKRQDRSEADKTLQKKRDKGLIALGSFSDVIQESKEMQNCIHMAGLYSQSERPVLIIGETGTHMRLIAQGIHNNSIHNEGPFAEVHCRGGSSNEQREAIFGEQGAAYMAAYGTLFLEDIDALSLENQANLYKLIRFRLVENHGRSLHVPVRVIATAKRALSYAVADGKFREDLYYLIEGLTLNIPPLRSRPEDLRAAAEEGIKAACEKYSRYHILTQGAWDKIMNYSWYGNFLQLESFFERLILTAKKRTIDELAVNALWNELYMTKSEEELPEQEYYCEEAEQIRHALALYGGNRGKAADELGISKATLWRKMKKYEIKI